MAGGAGRIVNRARSLDAVGKQGTTAGQQQVEAVGITLREMKEPGGGGDQRRLDLGHISEPLSVRFSDVIRGLGL